MAKRLLILGPTFKRNKKSGVLPAIERYDGVFFRVSRKNLRGVKDVDVLVMNDDLILVNSKSPLLYSHPKGKKWGSLSVSKEVVRMAKKRNEIILGKKLKKRKYSEVFIAMGKKYAEALPDLSQYGLQIFFPTAGGIGPKAQALKEWLNKAQ